MAETSMADMVLGFQGLLASGKYSDCTLVCGEVEYKLHKAVVCSRSAVLDAAFSSDMKEKETGKIVLEEDKPEAVKSMIDFFYTLDYQPSPPTTTGKPTQAGAELPTIVHHARVYAIADKYDIRTLRELAVIKFKRACELWWDNGEFAQAALEAYSTTVEEERCLRDVVVNTIAVHKTLLEKPEVVAVIRDTMLSHDLVFTTYKSRAGQGNYEY